MKYLFLLLILPLLFLSFSANVVDAQISSIPFPSTVYCIGDNPQPPCATIAPTQPISNPSPVVSTAPNPSSTQTTSPSPSSAPSPSTNPCATESSSVTAQSSGATSSLSQAKKRKPTGNGLVQQFFGFMMQLFQLLLQQIGGQTPGTGTSPSPTQTPGQTNPCVSPSPSMAVSTTPSSAPTSPAVSPTTAPVSTAPSVAPTSTPPTTTTNPTLLQQLLQLLLQLLQYLFQQLGISLPCPSGTCAVPTPSLQPSTSPSPSSGSPSSPSPSVIATPTVFETSPLPSSGVSPTSGIPPTQGPIGATSTPPSGTVEKTGSLVSALDASGTTTNLCLDNRNSTQANDNPVQTWKCLGDTAQQWEQYSDNTIRYKANTNYCLDVNKRGTANDTLVDLFTCNGGTNQQWKLTNNANGKTELQDVQDTKMCLDIKGSSTANGTQLEIYTCNNGNNQVWSWNASTTPPTSGGSGTTTTKWAYLAPTGLKATNITATGATLTWNKVTGTTPTVSGVNPPSSYEIAAYTTSGSLIPGSENQTNTAQTADTTYPLTGLPSGTVVVIHVWANGGSVAPAHDVIEVNLAKSGSTGSTTPWAYLAPTNLKVTSHTATSVSLSWSAVTGSKPTIPGGVPKPTGYDVAIYNSSKGTLIGSYHPTTTTSDTVTGLPSGSKININVWATGGPLNPPNAPINGYTL